MSDHEPQRPDEYCLETRRQVDRLHSVLEGLVDAVQTLTASRFKLGVLDAS